MANTIIQIKRSSATSAPVGGSLSAAEPAYSYLSEKLFLGDAAGTGIIEIGGKYWIDHTNKAFDQANAAYNTANNNNVQVAFNQANSAFDKANAANVLAFNVGAYANTAFLKLNDGNQTITGDIAITGNLYIQGNTVTVGASDLVIEDSVFLLANNNTTDIKDIGFAAHYANATSTQVHTGLIRDPGTKQWYLFKEYNDHFFYSGGNINLSGNNFTLDTLNANFVTNSLTLGGANAIITIGAAYDKANAANVLAFNTGIGANAWANSISLTRSTASNAWSNTISNTRAIASNAYATAVGNAANTNAANGSYISAGIVKVTYGGTGMTSFTQNGILFGNTAGDLKVTSAGTEGQVLQASATGVPQFGMIDGGQF